MTPKISIAIPTFGRDSVLLQTVRYLLNESERASELILLDQTLRHAQPIEIELEHLERRGEIRWIRLGRPSITKAMNIGLRVAQCEIVLFLDDDIIPETGLVTAHAMAHSRTGAAAVAGRVIQPWEEDTGQLQSSCSFSRSESSWVHEFMAGNVSVNRETAIQVGGFDENFVKVAYRFEAEFAYRLRQRGHRIYYSASACVRHLKVPSGGTRVFGDHLRSFRPNHSVGEYYFILRTWDGFSSVARFVRRPFRAVATRHHLMRPWWIPATLIAELAGMLWAILLLARGSRRINSSYCDHM
jgi:GT2 family glycosyltransferase